jgi:DNA repair exonuclease SbcCD ATPase subunit
MPYKDLERRRASARKYYVEHLDKYKEYSEKNKEKIAARKRKHHAENKERLNIISKKYYEKNKNSEEVKIYRRNYYKNNKEKIRAQSKKYRTANPDKVFAQNLKSRLGITPEQWWEMYYAQDEKCALCGEYFQDEDSIVVDHNHKTGKVRGLLHSRCNTAIGLLHDDPELLDKAAQYLRRSF